MRKFKVGDRVLIIDAESSYLPLRFLNCSGELLKLDRYTKDSGNIWKIQISDCERIYEIRECDMIYHMNRNGANEVSSERSE